MKQTQVQLRLVTPDEHADVRRVGGPERHDQLAAVARLATAGDPAAVRTFLTTIGPHLLHVVRRVLGPGHPDVEDVAQECAYHVMDALPRFRGDSTLLHFVCRVAVLTAMNAKRRAAAEKRPTDRDDVQAVDSLPGSLPLPDAALVARTSAEALRNLLTSLPPNQAEALALHCVLGYTVAEIAASSGTSVETVRSRLRLSKQAIREKLLHDRRLKELIEEHS